MELTPLERILLVVLLAVALWLFVKEFVRKIRLIRLGRPEKRWDNAPARIRLLVNEAILQRRVMSGRRGVGIVHALVFWGFLLSRLATVDHFSEGFGSPLLGHGSFPHGYALAMAGIALVVLAGVVVFVVRRFVLRPRFLTYPARAWVLVLSFILVLMVTHLLIAAPGTPAVLAKTFWWVHTSCVLGLLVVIPRSDYLHLILAPFNLFFKELRFGRLRQLNLEDEEAEDFGVNTLADLSWKDLLDLTTCVECGRCQEECPAYLSEKTLNPKLLIKELKGALFEERRDTPIVGDVYPAEAIWQCTTCGACQYHCPLGIEHLAKAVGTRRYQTAESAFPKEAMATFQGLERNFNPWNYGREKRADLIRELGIPLFADGTEYYLWLGCFGAFDLGYRPVIEALLEVLRAAGVSFGVLEDEVCCGDPARRLGNEFLYQTLAQENATMLREAGVKKIVTACPHCMQTLLVDYSDLGAAFDVTHHTALLQGLAAGGKLSLDAAERGPVVFHDPCYLSRYREQVRPARELLAGAGYGVRELPRTQAHSFCCGAGGGCIFLEETQGSRINHLRCDEVLASGVGTLASACPYCYTMLRDGLADKGAEEKVRLCDVVQLLAPAANGRCAGG